MIRVFGLMLLFVISNASAELIATVDKNQVAKGKVIKLTLQLIDAKPRGMPDTKSLQNYFQIYSQTNFNNVSIINGRRSSQTGWDLLIIPKVTGDILIEPIKIDTNKGTLSSKPILISVIDGQVEQTNLMDINLQIDSEEVYVGQAVVATLTIRTSEKIASTHLSKLKVNDAIVETIESASSKKTTYTNGVKSEVFIEKYIINPLKPGKMLIEPIRLTGQIIHHQSSSVFGFFDPFAMNATEPFSIETKQQEITVLPPLNSSWYPAKSIKLEEEISDTYIQGQPISWKITMTAVGLLGSQLPELTKQLTFPGFSVYPDPAISNHDFDNTTNSIIGKNQQQFTLIPDEYGKMQLPEVKITWWDIKNKQQRIAKIPSKTIEVSPAQRTQSSDTNQAVSKPVDFKLYVLIYILIAIIILLLVIIAWFLLKKPKSRAKINSIAELKSSILAHMQHEYAIDKNTPLQQIVDELQINYDFDKNIIKLFEMINASLYANKDYPLEQLLQMWNKLKTTIAKKNKNMLSTHHINPT